MPMWPDGGGWVAWLIMSLSMIAFWALVIWAVLALVRSNRDAGAPPPPRYSRDDPEEILAARYAAGEIDDEEYTRRLDGLRERSSPRQRT